MASRQPYGPKGKMCRPFVVNDLDENGNVIRKPFIELRNMNHPGLKLKNEKIRKHNLTTTHNKISTRSFVPNTTLMKTEDEPARTLLVTGPNMGGKSTLLRQTCLAIILA